MFIPAAYLDPFTLEVMNDPVLAKDGNTFERASIEEWFRREHKTSPMTGQTLADFSLPPNVQMRQDIITFINQHSANFRNSGTTGLSSNCSAAMWLELSLDLKENILGIADSNRNSSVEERKARNVPNLFQDIRSISRNGLLHSTSPLLLAANDSRHPHMIDACLGMVKALRAFRKNPGLVQVLIQAMGRLAQQDGESKPNSLRLGALGACELISCVLRDWSHHAEITKTALHLVGHVSKIHFETLTALQNAENCKDVVSALSSFPSDADVQFQGCWAVSMLGLAPGNRAYLHDLGACNGVVGALKSFPSDPKVQAAGCQAICTLAVDSEVAFRLGDPGGPEAVVAALKTLQQRRDKHVYFALKAIVLLAAAGTNNLRKFKSMKAGDHVAAAIKGSPEVPEVQRHGRKALKLVCTSGSANSIIQRQDTRFNIKQDSRLMLLRPHLTFIII